MNRRAFLWGPIVWIAAVIAQAQSSCPAVSFETAVTANLMPSGASHINLVRQGDGSYTGFEVANAAPYSVLRTVPNFQAPLTQCVPPQSKLPPLNIPQPASLMGQAVALTALPSGGFLQALNSAITGHIEILTLDSNMNPVSDVQLPYSGGYSLFAFADVNGDGAPDLIALMAIPPANPAVVEVFFAGATGFGTPMTYAVPQRISIEPSPVFAVADVTGDGKLDLLVWQPDGNLVYLLEGNGDGTFQAATSLLTLGWHITSVVVGDLNGDGKPDLVLSGETQSSSRVVGVLLGSGNGSFAPISTFDANGAGSVVIGDVNGDALPDIVMSSGNGTSVLFGDGKGGFPQRADYQSGGGGIVLADLNGDGRMDIISGASGNAAVTSGNANTTVLFGLGGGAFWGAPVSEVPGLLAADNGAITAVTGDFNGDGIPDVVVGDLAGHVTLLLGQGNGVFHSSFQYTPSAALAGFAVGLAVGDFNHDGKLDVAAAVTAKQPFVLVLTGNGDGTLAAPIQTLLPGGLDLSAVAASDFNGDAKLDLAVAADTLNGGTADEVLLLAGNGDGTFATPTVYPAGPVASAVAVGDFNGDGRPDLAIGNTGRVSQQAGMTALPGNLTILLGKGDGTFTALAAIPLSGGTGAGPCSFAVSDLNGDGKPDLAVSVCSAGSPTSGLSVLLGHGDGTFSAPVSYAAPSSSVAVGDLNGDRIPDLVVSSAVSYAGYLIGNEDGTFEPETVLPGYAGPALVTDWNQDGRLDVGGAWAFGVDTFLNTSTKAAPPFVVVSAASFEQGPLAPDSLATAFGFELATTNLAAGQPPPPSLGGTAATLKDSTGATLPASLVYVSPEQVNFVMPAGAAAGAGTITISAPHGSSMISLTAPVQIARIAPAVFILNGSALAAAYADFVAPDGTESYAPDYTVQSYVIDPVQATPIVLHGTPDQVYLTLFGTGFRNAGSVTVNLNGQSVPVIYAGAQPVYAGLDQINVLLPTSLAGSGLVPIPVSIVVSADGVAANTVYIEVE